MLLLDDVLDGPRSLLLQTSVMVVVNNLQTSAMVVVNNSQVELS